MGKGGRKEGNHDTHKKDRLLYLGGTSSYMYTTHPLDDTPSLQH